MKLEVGMYVRTKRGTFDRFITSHKNENLTWYTFEDRGNITNPENYIIKASHNIIDLIEVGDYVNGKEVICNEKYELKLADIEGNWGIRFVEEAEIETIVTREQFEAMQYKVVEE